MIFAIIGLSVLMVSVGNRLLGEALGDATGHNETVQGVVGSVWALFLVTTFSRLVNSDDTHPRPGRPRLVLFGLLACLAFLTEPVAGRAAAQGASAGAPVLGASMLVGILVLALGMYVRHTPQRGSRKLTEEADARHATNGTLAEQRAHDCFAYRTRLASLGGDVNATDDAWRTDYWRLPSRHPLPARPSMGLPDTSCERVPAPRRWWGRRRSQPAFPGPA